MTATVASSPISSTVQEVLHEMVSKLPKDIFEKSTSKATRRILVSVGLVTAGVVMIYNLPWYLLPLGWLFMGTACCGLFSVGYACGKNLLFKNRAINYTVGTILMLPLMYPFEYWKRSTGEVRDYVRDLAKGPYWWLMSLRQWATSNVASLDSRRMLLSAAALYLFASIFLPLMTYGFGLWVPRFVQYLTQDFNIGVILARLQTQAENSVNAVIDFPPAYKWKEAYHVLKKEYQLNISEENIMDVLLKVGPLAKKIICPQPEQEQQQQPLEAPKKKSIFDGKPWYEKVVWTTTIFIFATPLLSMYGIATSPFNWKTYVTAFCSYYIAGIGITAGYHRLFSHRSYDAVWPVRVILTLMGTTAFEMSVIDWCHDHRAHHRFTDTDKDPYNVKKGFWWAHMGWLIFKREEEPDADVTDLKNDWVLYYQHKYYTPLSLFFGIFLPTWICGHYWGDWRGGFFIAGIASKVLMMQCTFCINSLAHYLGEATYTDQKSPRDSAITSLVTFGEGYHNFHHEFPYDYRNGIHHSAYDPGKWLIGFLSWFGLSYNLKRFPAELFEKGKIQMAEKKAADARAKLFWGKPLDQLDIIDRETVKRTCADKGKKWIIIHDIVYDVEEFQAKHPGGVQFIKDYIGKDASKAFDGLVYNHSFAARNILDTYRIAKLK
ncbi:delta 9 fatty acid desaturase [Cavenderia fasciculata]|uniref:Delta 9 fatty acid desaturase n=1 Tax=Cavenderia fasciculata TaxID=261658 RepID=F4PSQ0_CACFS|nr:delta 9 fatty acid desaturase [Cavenderia fasciculata]EGG21528.1 delta 9 fatty acid desaturase [Cavenderia fasciculata]|eukprot:XP_004359378.1 delta 9 fatty acid desaturase [Cavenderia fasciculata]